MPDRLPVRVDPYRLAEQSLTVSGFLQTDKMDRYKSSVIRADKQIHAQLDFSKQGAEHYLLQGHIKTAATLVCQRCLEDYQHQIENKFELSIVASDFQAGQEMESVEPLVIPEGEMLELTELLEDEIILALPVVSMHQNDADCQLPEVQQSAVEETVEDKETKPSPFEVLKDLKRD